MTDYAAASVSLLRATTEMHNLRVLHNRRVALGQRLVDLPLFFQAAAADLRLKGIERPLATVWQMLEQ